MLSCGARYLEFDNVRVDLSNICFTLNSNRDKNNIYIIFINVKHVLFTNFQLITDLSLENVATKIFKNVKFTVNGVSIILQDANTRISIDRDQFSIIDLGYNSRITIAKQL